MSTPSGKKLNLSAQEITRAFNDSKWEEKFPPILSFDQAAELAQIPKATLYEWSSRGRLVGCSRKVGKHVRIWRDKFIDLIFNKGINNVQ